MKNQRGLLGLMIILFMAGIYAAVIQPILSFSGTPLPPLPGGVFGSSAIFGLFAVSHAVYSLGWRHTLIFLGLSVVISWALEQAGVASGTIYGGYHYTDVLGARVGYVPIIIPLSWFEYLYCSYILANCLLADRPVGTDGNLARVLLLSIVTAALVTAQDLIIDPIMSGPLVRAWVWETPGAYFGVPAQNFAGWLVTSLVASVLFRLFQTRWPLRSTPPLSRAIVTMPLIVYGLNILVGMTPLAPPALKVISPFVLGLPLLLALGRIWLPAPRQNLFDGV